MSPIHGRRLAYGVGSVGTGIFTTAPAVLLLYFLTVEVRIDAAIAGLIILIPKAMGLVGDPFVGVLADRLRARAPIARQMLMGLGALVAGLGLWAMFTFPQRHPGEVVLPGLIYFACTAGYSLFAVPYSALPAELDPTPDGRRALVAVRLGLAFVGVLIGGVSAPIIAERAGHAVMGVVAASVSVGAMALFLLACRLPAAIDAHRAASTPTARSSGVASALSRPFLVQAGAFVLLLAAAGTSSALLPFLVRALGAGGDVIGAGMLLNILVALATSVVWPRLIRRLGLRTVWLLAAAVTGLGALTVGVAPGVDLVFFAGMALGGAGLAGVQIVGFTGLADLTARQLEEGRGGGLITGLWMAAEKAGLASGPLFAGLGLTLLGGAEVGAGARTAMALIPTTLAALALMTIAVATPTARSAAAR